MNRIKDIVSPLVIAILAIIVVYLYIGNMNAKNVNTQNIKASNDTIKTYQDKLGRVVSEKDAYLVSLRDIKHLNDSLGVALKNIKPQTIIEYKTEYKDTTKVEVVYIKELPIKFNIPFSYSDKWCKLQGMSTNKGLTFYNREFYNKQTIILGMKSTGLFSRDEVIARVVNTNPKMKVLNMTSYSIKTKKANKLKILGVGVGIGTIATLLLLN